MKYPSFEEIRTELESKEDDADGTRTVYRRGLMVQRLQKRLVSYRVEIDFDFPLNRVVTRGADLADTYERALDIAHGGLPGHRDMRDVAALAMFAALVISGIVSVMDWLNPPVRVTVQQAQCEDGSGQIRIDAPVDFDSGSSVSAARDSSRWQALAPMHAAVARVDRLCDALQRERSDLYRDWRPVCREIAARAPAYGVRPALALAVAWHESRLNPYAIGALGEVGPLQVRPEMHCGGSDCADRIGAGLTVLARYVARHGEDAAMCRYRGAPAGCDSPRVALANAIEGE